MQPIEPRHFHSLLEHITTAAPDLITACRWLACGPGMAPLILGEDIGRPSATDLARLAAVAEAAPAEGAAAGRALLAGHNALFAKVRIALEHLIGLDDAAWSHPTEILGRPCPEFALLLAACRDRLANAEGKDRPRLESVRIKLERALALEARALRRRTK